MKDQEGQMLITVHHSSFPYQSHNWFKNRACLQALKALINSSFGVQSLR
jgi:hypothetical protein